CMQTLEFPYGF
nr:immunoglobulin light chain junction region [Macaca mulatta]